MEIKEKIKKTISFHRKYEKENFLLAKSRLDRKDYKGAIEAIEFANSNRLAVIILKELLDNK